MKTEDDDILPYRLTVYKAVPQPNMTLSFANEGVLLHSGRTHPVMRETPLSVLFSMSVQKIVPASDKFQSVERHASLYSNS